jgi:hypothetical protein
MMSHSEKARLEIISNLSHLGRHEAERLPRLVWTSLAFQVLSELMGSLVVAALTPLLVERVLKIPGGLVAETKLAFLVLAVSLPVLLATNALRGVLGAAQRFDLVNYLKVPANISVFLLPAVVALVFGLRHPAIVLLLVISQLGAAPAYLAISLKIFPALGQNLSLDFKMFRPFMTYGGWVIVSAELALFLSAQTVSLSVP